MIRRIMTAALLAFLSVPTWAWWADHEKYIVYVGNPLEAQALSGGIPDYITPANGNMEFAFRVFSLCMGNFQYIDPADGDARRSVAWISVDDNSGKNDDKRIVKIHVHRHSKGKDGCIAEFGMPYSEWKNWLESRNALVNINGRDSVSTASAKSYKYGE